MEGEEYPELGMDNLHQTPPRGHSTPFTDPDRVLVPILARASLEWDRSCLQEPFLGGNSEFLGIHRLEKRKPSATDPHFVDNDKLLIVISASSSFYSSNVRLVESAGNIPISIMLDGTLASDAKEEPEAEG